MTPKKQSPEEFLARLYERLYMVEQCLPFRLDRDAYAAIQRAATVVWWLRQYVADHDTVREDHCRALFVTEALQPDLPPPPPGADPFLNWRLTDRPTYHQMLTLCTPEAAARLTDRVEKVWYEMGTYGPVERRQWVRRTCGAQTKSGTPCRTTALFRQQHCWRHGGDRRQAQDDLERVGAERVAAILARIPDPAERLGAAAAIQTPVDPKRLKGPLRGPAKWRRDKMKQVAQAALAAAPPEVQLAVAASRAA